MNIDILIEYYLKNISLLYQILKNKEYKIYIAMIVIYIPFLLVACYYIIINNLLIFLECIGICGICVGVIYEMIYRIHVKINNEIGKRYYFKTIINRKNHFRFSKIYFFLEQKELIKYLRKYGINNCQEKDKIVELLKRKEQSSKIVITGVISALIIPAFSKCIAELVSEQEGFENQMLFLMMVLVAILIVIGGISLLRFIVRSLKNILVTPKKYCINQLIYDMQEIIVFQDKNLPTN